MTDRTGLVFLHEDRMTAPQETTSELLPASQDATLKYSLLGPSLTKAGQESVDQKKVSDIIYSASRGSKYFNREKEKDEKLTFKIERMREKKAQLEKQDLSCELRAADNLIAELELSRNLSQYIVHVDCDAFYAAVEQVDRPELKEVPFAVGGGVLTTCNYIARQFGCRSGMAGFVAKKLCPDLVFLPLNFEKYTAKAKEVREVIADYDPDFESASIDEAYMNITGYCQQHDISPEQAVSHMRSQVREKTGITISAGIAANARLAKICSNINKPNGQFVLPNDRIAIMSFVKDLPCRKVNGIGRVMERELKAIGIEHCGDLHDQRQYLKHLLGERAFEFLIRCYLGFGRTSIRPADEYERKSVGTESTFRDISDPKLLREKLRWTAEELEKDMRKAECKAKTLVLKVKLHTFDVYTRQSVLPKAVHLADDLYNHAVPILAKLEQELSGMRIRLMGLRCTHLISTKRVDTREFFGLGPKSGVAPNETGQVLRDMVEVVEAARDDREKKGAELPERHQVHADVQAGSTLEMKKNSSCTRATNVMYLDRPTKRQALTQGRWWECPICNRPQAADERQLNDHIDACLSRRAIRDAVQKNAIDHQIPANRGITPEPKRRKCPTERGRARPRAAADPKQKRLCFG